MNNINKKILFLLIILIFFITINSTSAKDIYVDSNSTNIVDIVNDASDGDKIHLNNKTYTGNEINIDKNITIDGKNNVFINGSKSNIFNVAKSGHLILKDLTLQNGFAKYGGAIYNYGHVTLINVTIVNCESQYYGGAIFNDEGSLTIENSSLISNTALNQGGAIHTKYGTIFISNSILSNNTSSRGGAIYNEYGTIDIKNSLFDKNKMTPTGELGGAIKNWGTLNVDNTTFSNNDGGYEGGAIYNFYEVFIKNSIFINNSATYGGAIANIRGTLNITTSTIKNNKGNTVSGIYCQSPEVFIEKNTIINNTLSSDKPIKISYNWWGDNNGPTIMRNINATSWVVMNLSSKPENIVQNENYTLIVSLNRVYDNITKTITPINGFINNPVKILSNYVNVIYMKNGICETAFETTNKTNVSAIFDHQILTLFIKNTTLPEYNETNNTLEENITNSTQKEESDDYVSNVTSLEILKNPMTTKSNNMKDLNKEETIKNSTKDTIKNNEDLYCQKTGNILTLIMMLLITVPLNLFKKKK